MQQTLTVNSGLPSWWDLWGSTASNYALDASGKVVSWRLTMPTTATVTKVGILVASVTGSSPTYTIGIESDNGSGVASGTYLNGGGAYHSQTLAAGWTEITLDSNTGSIAAGTVIHVTIRYSSGTINASNKVTITDQTTTGSGVGASCLARRYDGASWTAFPANPPVFSAIAGTTYYGGLAVSALASAGYSSSGPDHIGVKFTAPADMTLTGVKTALSFGATGQTNEVRVYDYASNLLGSATIPDLLDGNGLRWSQFFTPISLSSGQTYRVVFYTTSAVSNSIRTLTVVDWAGLPANYILTQRTGSGAWTDTATAYPCVVLLVDTITAAWGAPAVVSPMVAEIAHADDGRYVYFKAVDSTDLETPETSLTGVAVNYSLDGGANTAMTTPTVQAVDAANQPGVHSLAIDEAGMVTLGDGVQSAQLVLTISSNEARSETLYVNVKRPALTAVTAGRSLLVDTDGRIEVSGTLNTLDDIQSLIAALNDVAVSDIWADGHPPEGFPLDALSNASQWLDRTVWTSARAAKLDNLDAPVTTVPNAQDIRDAMKLAPSAGAPAADSIDEHLDDILEDTGTTLPELLDALGPGTGARTVIVTVLGTGDVPIMSARVAAAATEDGLPVARATSNSSGQCTLRLDDGTWWLHAFGVTGYEHNPESVVVDESPETFELSMAAFNPGQAADPAQRRVYVRLRDIQAQYPSEDTSERPVFTVRLKNAASVDDDTVVSMEKVESTEADDHSYAYCDLLPTDTMTPFDENKPAEYVAHIPAAKLTVRFELDTDDLSSVNLLGLS